MTIANGFGLKPDPDFEVTEQLFRRVSPDQLDGEKVLVAAVEDIKERHPSCSFNRGKYSDPEDVLDSTHPEYNRIACLTAGNLPAPIPHPTTPELIYSFCLLHIPTEENYSHSEAQVVKQGDNATQLKSPVLRRLLREALAEKMTVLPE